MQVSLIVVLRQRYVKIFGAENLPQHVYKESQKFHSGLIIVTGVNIVSRNYIIRFDMLS